MKIALLNDTHCGIRNSSDVFINYQERFYRDVFFPHLLENDIKHIVHLGDYYEHRRFVNFKALHANRKFFLEKLREYKITMDIIPGNHDTYYKTTNSLNSLKELLGHYMNEINIIEDPTVMTYGSLKMGLVPWICPENEEQCHDFLMNCKADIIGGHFELVGFDVLRGIKNTQGMSTENLKRFETVVSGHFHCKSHNDNIHYLGAQMEFFWGDVDDPKYFHVLDTETRELTPVRNPLTIYKRIYYDDEKTNYSEVDLDDCDGKFVKIVVLNKTDPFTFDRFVDRVASRNIHELKIQEDMSEFLGENVEDEGLEIEDTAELLRGYVDNVETTLDKERLKQQLIHLMKESETMELV